MKKASTLVAMLALFAVAAPAAAHVPERPKKNSLDATIAHQEKSLAHARYVCARGSGEPKRWHCAAVRWIDRELAETRSKLEVRLSPRAAICAVFGPYCSQAWSVALCEGGRPVPSVYARNGQYLGMFQMGEYARGRYGHSWTAIGQARAAYRYFVDSGRDWSPWECKP